jgi:hypothetical protein
MLLRRRGAVLDTPGNDVKLTLIELDVAVAQLDREMPFEDKEEVVGFVVLVPDELTLHLDDPHVLVVELGDDLRLPVLIEELQLLAQVDRFADRTSVRGRG